MRGFGFIKSKARKNQAFSIDAISVLVVSFLLLGPYSFTNRSTPDDSSATVGMMETSVIDHSALVEKQLEGNDPLEKESAVTHPPALNPEFQDYFAFQEPSSGLTLDKNVDVFLPPTTLFFADFEGGGGDNSWIFNGGATDGDWIRARPRPYATGGNQMEIAAFSGRRDLLTGRRNGQDLDGGPTSANSEPFLLPAGTQITISWQYYFSHYLNSSNADYLIVELRESVTNNTLVRLIEERGMAASRPAQWTTFITDISAFAGSTAYIYVEAADLANGSKVEAAMDDVLIIYEVSNSLSGKVYEEYNNNGIMDTGEPGWQGVNVSLFDANGLISQVLTDANGDYSFSGLTSGQVYRLEFNGFPTGIYESTIGPDSRTAVQFASPGTANANLGLYDPFEACEDDPFVILPCYVEGEYNGPYGFEPTLVKFLYSADGHDFVGANTTLNYEVQALANHDEIGTVYGLAWQKTTKIYYSAAYHKRYTGFGPQGADAIYMMDMNGSILGVLHLDALLGTTNSTGGNVHDFVPAANGEIYDLGKNDISFDAAGKRAFGDIELSKDMNTLYVLNLFDRKIYALNVAGGTVGSVTISNSWDAPDQTGGARHRPFGLAWHNDKLWVGSVDENGLFAYVHSLDPSTSVFNLELSIPMNYARQAYYGSATNINAPGEWNSWQVNTNFSPHNNSNEIAYPQPILSDIEFADNGDMIIGFRDRFGDQVGAGKRFDIVTNTLTWGIAQGDILKACFQGGTYVLESGTTGACASTAGLDNSGPGGVEFYHWDIYELPGQTWDPSVSNGAFHWETNQGGLLALRGSGHVMTTAMDPFNDFSGGVIKLNNLDGGREGIGTGSTTEAGLTGGYTVFDGGDYNGSLPPNIGLALKANGLGDLEAACNLSMTIGNLVWFDEDEDGIQDPGEAVLTNVVVELYNDGGILIGSDTTDNTGYYYFGGLGDYALLLSNSLLPNTVYEIRINLASAETNDGSVSGIKGVTQRDVVSNSLDHLDNDAQAADDNSYSFITALTGDWGQNDYSFDFGFSNCAILQTHLTYDGCQGDGYNVLVNGIFYNESNPTGLDTLISVEGCDSIVTVDLTFQPTYSDLISYNGCQGDGFTIIVNNITYNELNPVGVESMTTVYGCDSTITVNLIFNLIPTVEAGMLPGPVCSNTDVVLTALNASISGGITTGTWTTTGTGIFDNGGNFGGGTPATIYTLSTQDIDAGFVILTLTSDDPPGSCEPEADAALVIINDLRCSTFPFSGN